MALSTFSILFASAQTDAVLVDVLPNQRLEIRRIVVACDNANQADVGTTIGFTANDRFTGHPGIAAGSGLVEKYEAGDIEGALGQRLLFSCEAPTGGAIRVSGSYIKHSVRS